MRVTHRGAMLDQADTAVSRDENSCHGHDRYMHAR